jgi:hypothetical protein
MKMFKFLAIVAMLFIAAVAGAANRREQIFSPLHAYLQLNPHGMPADTPL